MSFSGSAMILTWLAILFLALAVSGLIRQVRVLARSLPSEVRFHAADIERLNQPGRSDRLILFVDADCQSCTALRPALTEIIRSEELDLIVAFRSPVVWSWLRNLSQASGNESRNLTILPGAQGLFEGFRVQVLPHAVALDGDNRVTTSLTVGSAQALLKLMDKLVSQQKMEEPENLRGEVANAPI